MIHFTATDEIIGADATYLRTVYRACPVNSSFILAILQHQNLERSVQISRRTDSWLYAGLLHEGRGRMSGGRE